MHPLEVGGGGPPGTPGGGGDVTLAAGLYVQRISAAGLTVEQVRARFRARMSIEERAVAVVKAKAAPLAMTLGLHSNDEMISFYARSPSGFQIEYGTGGLLIDDAEWLPPRFDVPSFWGHVRVNAAEADVLDT